LPNRRPRSEGQCVNIALLQPDHREADLVGEDETRSHVVASVLAGLACSSSVVALGMPASVYGIAAIPDNVLVLLAFGGGAVAAWLGLGKDNITGFLVQRLCMVAVVLFLSPWIGAVFNWPLDITRAVGVIGVIVSPLVGTWLVSACLLAIGLQCGVGGAYVILVTCALLIHIATAGAWLPRRASQIDIAAPRSA
jgi:hypothetical protein